MGRKFQYVTLDRILAKIYRDLGLEEISETDVIEWTGEALNFMESPSLLEEAVAFVEVNNHQAMLPNGLHSIIQVAKNNYFDPSKKVDSCPAVQVPLITGQEDSCQTNFCSVDYNGWLENDCKIDSFVPYYDIQFEYLDWMTTDFYKEQFTAMRLANHSFFGNIVCEEDPQIYNEGCTDEYTIVGDRIKTSFKTGQVAIAFSRQQLDKETGYPMVPDDASFSTAITMYITMKYMARLWYMGREGYGDKMQKAEADWQWYCKQASNKGFMLYGEDEHQSRYQLIPNLNRHFGFFGKMSRTNGVANLRGV